MPQMYGRVPGTRFPFPSGFSDKALAAILTVGDYSTDWYPFAQFQGYYRLDNGRLMYANMGSDGSIREDTVTAVFCSDLSEPRGEVPEVIFFLLNEARLVIIEKDNKTERKLTRSLGTTEL